MKKVPESKEEPEHKHKHKHSKKNHAKQINKVQKPGGDWVSDIGEHVLEDKKGTKKSRAFERYQERKSKRRGDRRQFRSRQEDDSRSDYSSDDQSSQRFYPEFDKVTGRSSRKFRNEDDYFP